MNSLLTSKFPLAAILLLIVIMFSCTHENEAAEDKKQDPNVKEWQDSVISGDATMSSAPMLFSISGMTVSREEPTRGYANTTGNAYTLEENDIVSIEVSSSLRTTDVKDYLASETGDATAGGDGISLTCADGFFWKSTGETVTLRAWSYGNTTTTTADPDDAVYTLPADQSSNYGELLYSPAAAFDYENYHEGIDLSLYHQLARVVINVSYDSGSTLTNVRIGDGTSVIPRTAKFHKPESGNIGTWDTFGSETSQIIPKTETPNTCYSAVLIPKTYPSGTKFICITIGSETFAYTLGEATTLQPGNQYNYSIKIKNRLITFSVTVTAWTDNSRTLNF